MICAAESFGIVDCRIVVPGCAAELASTYAVDVRRHRTFAVLRLCRINAFCLLVCTTS